MLKMISTSSKQTRHPWKVRAGLILAIKKFFLLLGMRDWFRYAWISGVFLILFPIHVRSTLIDFYKFKNFIIHRAKQEDWNSPARNEKTTYSRWRWHQHPQRGQDISKRLVQNMLKCVWTFKILLNFSHWNYPQKFPPIHNRIFCWFCRID